MSGVVCVVGSWAVVTDWADGGVAFGGRGTAVVVA